MNSSPDATSEGSVARRGDARRVAGLFLTAVVTLAVTSMVLEWLPFRTTEGQPTGSEAGQEPRPFGMEPEELYELYENELARLKEAERADEAELAEEAENSQTEDEEKDSSDLTRSTPTQLRIPALEVDAKVTTVGEDDETLSADLVPSDNQQVGWFEPGPSPGETGNSVMLGPVSNGDDEKDDAVFAKIGDLKVGEEIEVDRKDEQVVRFVVDSIRLCPQEFPTSLPENRALKPQLLLVSCGLDDAPAEVIISGTLVPPDETEDEEESEEDEEEEDDDSGNEEGDDGESREADD